MTRRRRSTSLRRGENSRHWRSSPGKTGADLPRSEFWVTGFTSSPFPLNPAVTGELCPDPAHSRGLSGCGAARPSRRHHRGGCRAGRRQTSSRGPSVLSQSGQFCRKRSSPAFQSLLDSGAPTRNWHEVSITAELPGWRRFPACRANGCRGTRRWRPPPNLQDLRAIFSRLSSTSGSKPPAARPLTPEQKNELFGAIRALAKRGRHASSTTPIPGRPFL